jgi:cyclic pyranopterin phosphate synthase
MWMPNPLTPNDVDQEAFCFYPFMQLLLQPNGVVSPCCWNQSVILGQIPKDKLGDVWNGETLQALRKEFLDGKPRTCDMQMRHIGCHRASRRYSYDGLELTQVQAKGPRRLDVRLNGRCNLQCVMCDVWQQPNGLYDESDFWKIGPTQIFPFLLEMDVLGGEPFVQSDTYKLIDMISAVNQKCSWAFVTNGHYKFTDAIRSRLDKITIRWMQVSLDSVNAATYSRVRVNGELARVLATIDELVEYRAQRAAKRRPFHLTISMCVQQLNWREIGAFFAFADRNEIQPILQFAYKPSEASLLAMPKGDLERVARSLEDLEAEHGHHRVGAILLPVREALANPAEART